MTLQNQTSTSKQSQDKELKAQALNEQVAKEQKQNQIDKQHNQEHKNGQTAKTEADIQENAKMANGEPAEQQEHLSDQFDKKTESTKMDDLKAKAIAIGEELLQKGEKILNELKYGKSDSLKNGEQALDGSEDKSAAPSDRSNTKDGLTQQVNMANLKDEALHKFEDTKQKITELVNEASVKLGELKQMATETMHKMKDHAAKERASDQSQDVKENDSELNSDSAKGVESKQAQDKTDKDQ